MEQRCENQLHESGSGEMHHINLFESSNGDHCRKKRRSCGSGLSISDCKDVVSFILSDFQSMPANAGWSTM